MKKGDKRTRLPSSQPVKFLQTVCLFTHHFQIDLNSPCLPPKMLKTNVACPGYFQEKVKTMVIAKVPYGHVKMVNWIVFMHICLIILSIASVSYYYYVIHACTSSHSFWYFGFCLPPIEIPSTVTLKMTHAYLYRSQLAQLCAGVFSWK